MFRYERDELEAIVRLMTTNDDFKKLVSRWQARRLQYLQLLASRKFETEMELMIAKGEAMAFSLFVDDLMTAPQQLARIANAAQPELELGGVL